jgi:hypothetical protein
LLYDLGDHDDLDVCDIHDGFDDCDVC